MQILSTILPKFMESKAMPVQSPQVDYEGQRQSSRLLATIQKPRLFDNPSFENIFAFLTSIIL